MSPFKARAEFKAHTPKDIQERKSLSLDVRSSRFEATPSFGQIPLFHSALRLITASMYTMVSAFPKFHAAAVFLAAPYLSWARQERLACEFHTKRLFAVTCFVCAACVRSLQAPCAELQRICVPTLMLPAYA